MSAKAYIPIVALVAGAFLMGQPVKRHEAAAPKTTAAPPSVSAVPQEKELSAEELAQTAKVPYQPSLIRDPFGSPSDLGTVARQESIDEVGIKGRVVIRGKSMAIITDSRGKTRPIPVGYKFRDGELVAVDDKGVTFRQWDPSSTSRTVFKTIVKSFKREEGVR